MKLSMWHILRELEDFQPEYRIEEGLPRISGLHLKTRWDDGPSQGEYAYLELPDLAAAAAMGADARFTVTVSNGPDAITLRDIPDANVVVNRLMALFTGYNDWESRLRRAAGRDDPQEVVDIATERLRNPILLFDAQSNVLAMSALFLDADLGPHWAACRETRRVPVSYSARAMALPNGQAASWTRQPRLYALPDGTRAIGNFLQQGDEIIAGFELREAADPIRPGDLQLVRLVEEALENTLRPQRESGPYRTLIHTLQDMLAGVEFEDHLYRMLRLPSDPPWRLAVVRSPFQREGEAMYRPLLLPRLRSLARRCLSLEFDGSVVALAPLDAVDGLIDIINEGAEEPCFAIGLSLPFDGLGQLRERYNQTAFTLDRLGDRPGLYRGEACILQYLASRDAARRWALPHPLLAALRAHDAQRGSELYDTLFQYLLQERSLQRAAATHVHKNTFSYRLDRIRELAPDLDDPLTRLTLLVSYALDGAVDGKE